MQKTKTVFGNIQKSIFNNTQEVMQETLLNGYYFSFFKKLRSETRAGKHKNITDVEFLENTKTCLRIKIGLYDPEHAEDGLKNLEWCLYDIKLSDAFKSREKKIKKMQKKMTDNFVKGFIKENKGKRFSISKVKDYFTNVWTENINKSLSDVCLKFSLSVVME